MSTFKYILKVLDVLFVERENNDVSLEEDWVVETMVGSLRLEI